MEKILKMQKILVNKEGNEKELWLELQMQIVKRKEVNMIPKKKCMLRPDFEIRKMSIFVCIV